MIWVTGLAFLLVTVFCSGAWSMDFVNMSNQELFELRGAIRNAPEADRQAYTVEWEKRLSRMPDEEKKQFADQVEEEKKDDGGLEPPKTPARGYEKQVGQGRIIFGGFPQDSGSGR